MRNDLTLHFNQKHSKNILLFDVGLEVLFKLYLAFICTDVVGNDIPILYNTIGDERGGDNETGLVSSEGGWHE